MFAGATTGPPAAGVPPSSPVTVRTMANTMAATSPRITTAPIAVTSRRRRAC